MIADAGIGDAGFAVSLPPAELVGAQLPGSLFTGDVLLSAPISEELRQAVDLLLETCAARGVRLQFVARPEMYCEGETLDWLISRLERIADHLSLSDGSAVRVIPSLRNHVFFYGQNRLRDQAAIQRLAERVPEFMSTLTSQVNTALAFRAKMRTVLLPSYMMGGFAAPAARVDELYGFYMNRIAVDDSVNRVVLGGPLGLDALSRFPAAAYVVLNEAALADEDFIDLVAVLISRAYFNPETCLILRLPSCKDVAAPIEDQLKPFFAALRHTQVSVPRVRAANVFLVAADLTDECLRAFLSVDLMIHYTAALWHRTAAYYAIFSTIRVCARRGPLHEGHFLPLLHGLLGRFPRLIPLGFAPREQGLDL